MLCVVSLVNVSCLSKAYLPGYMPDINILSTKSCQGSGELLSVIWPKSRMQ